MLIHLVNLLRFLHSLENKNIMNKEFVSYCISIKLNSDKGGYVGRRASLSEFIAGPVTLDHCRSRATTCGHSVKGKEMVLRNTL